MLDSKRDTDVKNRLLDSMGECRSGMISENSIETCILPYVKQMTSASSIHEAGHSKLVLWENPVRWGGGVQEKGMHVHLWLCLHMAKTTTTLYGN